MVHLILKQQKNHTGSTSGWTCSGHKLTKLYKNLAWSDESQFLHGQNFCVGNVFMEHFMSINTNYLSLECQAEFFFWPCATIYQRLKSTSCRIMHHATKHVFMTMTMCLVCGRTGDSQNVSVPENQDLHNLNRMFSPSCGVHVIKNWGCFESKVRVYAVSWIGLLGSVLTSWLFKHV